jgi:hypothetical protein
MKKYYTYEEISKKFFNLTKNKQIDILYEALDYMQQYNGRTRFECISLAMGYENDGGENTKYYKRKSYN